MNRAKTIRNSAECAEFDNKIDQILSAEDELVPSSGFMAAVMQKVQEEAAAPPPIPFPWTRALPGILTAAGVFGWGGYELIHQGLLMPVTSASKTFFQLPMYLPAAMAVSINQVGWVGAALGVSLLSWLFARRLSGRGGLL